MNLGKWLKGIRGRLMIVPTLPLIGFGIFLFISIGGVDRINSYLHDANTLIVPNLSAISDMREALISFEPVVLAFGNAAVADAKKAKYIKSGKESINLFKFAYKTYFGGRFSEGEDKIASAVKTTIPDLIATEEQIIGLLEGGTPEKIQQAMNLFDSQYKTKAGEVYLFIVEVLDLYSNLSKNNQKEAEEARVAVVRILVGVAAVSAILIFVILFLLASKVSTSVGKVADRLGDTGSHVVMAVEQLTATGRALSDSSSKTAATLEETVAAITELSSMVDKSSLNAREAAGLSAESKDAAENGEREIQDLIKSITEISKSSKKIEEIISVIDDIAFQTNLLALNAAVEAARAGEQGKGFAVVADAVRGLAQRSASSAKDISNLIHDSVGQIEKGSHIADKSGTVLTKIVESIKKVSELNLAIADASAEQASGLKLLSKAMNQLDESAQSNAASAEEIANSSGEISELATVNRDLTHELNVLIFG